MRISDWSSDVCSSDLEEDAIERTIARRLHRRAVEPRQEEQQRDRGEHRDDAPQRRVYPQEVEGEGAQDRVEGPEIPFGNDMRRRRKRVRRNIVVGVAEHVRAEEGQRDEHEQENAEPEAVLRGVIGMERGRVLLVLHIDAGRVVRPRNVQRPDVQDHEAKSEVNTSELQSLMRIMYAGFGLKTKN